MEIKDLKELIKLFSDSNVDQLSLEKEGFSLQLGKEKTVVTTVAADMPTAVAAVQAAPAPSAPVEEDEGLFIVTSPIVGTYYAAPNPDSDPFVSVGSTVHKGQTLCIVEAMKLMNEIVADVSGEVAKIFVENGEGVEFGQKLLGIKVG